MKILLTGGLGYIGSHTAVELIKKQHEVIILDNLYNSNIDVLEKIRIITGKTPVFYQGDINDREFLRNIFNENSTIDCCIHFAGLKIVNESLKIPLDYYANNISGTLCLLKVMAECGCKNLIFSSSASVYGEVEQVPISEAALKGQCSSPYAWSKSFIEQILSDLYQSDLNWNIVVLRYFNPVGAHSSYLIGEEHKSLPTNLMPYITQVALGQQEKLSVFGYDYPTKDGTGVRDFIHVVDLAQGHVAALKLFYKKDNGYHVFNLGTGQGFSVLDVIKTFEKVNHVTIPYELVERRPGDIAVSFADVKKAYNELDWKSKLDLSAMCIDSYQFAKLKQKR